MVAAIKNCAAALFEYTSSLFVVVVVAIVIWYACFGDLNFM